MKALRGTIACVFLASLLVGCGSTGQENASVSDPLAALAAAPEKTLDAKSARVFLSEENDRRSPLPGQQARAEVSFARREARLSFLSGDRYIYTASSWYVSHPENDPLTGKKWLRFERGKFSVGQDDRVRLIPYLAAGATHADGGDADKINDVETFRYEATVEVPTALQAVPEAARTLAQHVLEEQLLGRTGHARFWLDSAGRVRRIRVEVPPGRRYSRTDPNGDSITLASWPGTSLTTFDFTEFGVEVDAAPPPADEVGDLLSP